MQKEYQRLQTKLADVRTKLSTMPKGKLICSKGGKYYKWYVSDGHKKEYLPKGKRELAEQLAYKKYLTLLQEDLEEEKTALEFYLRHHSPYPGKATRLITNPSGFQELLTPQFVPLSKELSDWMNAPYESNMNYPEYLKHEVIPGKFVRSKSEVMIFLALYAHKIPFRYECALYLNGVAHYPDFTIRHSVTGKIYYWEHFGRADDPMYCETAFDKLKRYCANGIFPGIQLITTFETKDYPLGHADIERIIEQYFF